MKRSAKIVATIGPASRSPEIIRELLEAGMNVARLNFSHGSQEEHASTFALLRQAATETGTALLVLQDLQGPRLRTGELAGDDPIRLQAGSELELTAENVRATPQRIAIRYPQLAADLRPGDPVLIDDGKIRLEVTQIERTGVRARVVVGGTLTAEKGVNLPGVTLSTTALTEKDRQDLAFGLELGVDAVAMSFVRSAKDLRDLEQALAALQSGGLRSPIVAKLERPESLDRLDEILPLADGVMVARGDLGVEVSPEKVPSIQKRILQAAHRHNVITITATEMLDSMIENPRPTRAEASDVANAVFDGSDALMLSGETAVGSYPVQAVQTMNRIICDAEVHAAEWGMRPDQGPQGTQDDALATVRAAYRLAQDRDVAAIAVFTQSGRTARLMSKVRPPAPIIAFTPHERTYRQMAILWGVQPWLCPKVDTVEEIIQTVEREMLTCGAAERGQQVVVVASLPVGAMGIPNFSYLHRIG